MNQKTTIIAAISVSLILFVGFTIYFFKQAIPPRELPVLGKVQEFTLINSDDKAFGYDDLKGKVWVADFIFTTCGSVCPIMSQHMASLHRSYVLEPDTAFVTVTVNPENDTPEVLKKYANRYGADTEHWRFLTGARKDITDLAINSFKIGSMEEPIFHSTYMVLVDRVGQIRGYYEGTKAGDIQELFKDIAVVLKEGQT